MVRLRQSGTGYWTRYLNPALNNVRRTNNSGELPASGIFRIARETDADIARGFFKPDIGGFAAPLETTISPGNVEMRNPMN